ncbi:hypothetical protein ASB1_11460 [Helicobacter heilmannii]|nr:hypothetical protein ASB1_11460 [Helicobacter heilmannii]
MFEKLELIIKDIENAKEEVELLLRIAHLSLSDFILMKRGSLDIPPLWTWHFIHRLAKEWRN